MSQTPEQIEQSFQDLDYTQGVRKRIIGALVDKAITDKDPEMLSQVQKAADGMDKQSLGKLKINEKDKENQTKANESEALSKYLVALGNSAPPPIQERGRSEDRRLPQGNRPTYDESIRDNTPNTENSKEFIGRMEGGEKKDKD